MGESRSRHTRNTHANNNVVEGWMMMMMMMIMMIWSDSEDSWLITDYRINLSGVNRPENT